jgi:hypothetical protein
MTRLEEFKRLVNGSGGVITFTRSEGSYAISYTPGKFTKKGNGYGCLVRHKTVGALYPLTGNAELLEEFDNKSVDKFIQKNPALFDEALDTERYLSYQPTYKATTIEEIKNTLDARDSYYFEHNGYEYAIEKKYSHLATRGPMEKYHINYAIHGIKKYEYLLTFKKKVFDEFINEFTLDGTIVKEALKYQKGWKELCDANLLVGELGGMEYCGTYKGTEFGIDENGDYIYFNYLPEKAPPNALRIAFGPIDNKTELLEKVIIDGKTFKEIYDTEYDDGEVLKGYYGG